MQVQCREKYILYFQHIYFTPNRFLGELSRMFQTLCFGETYNKVRCFASQLFSPAVSVSSSQHIGYGAPVCKRLWSPGINSEESIPPAYEACTGRYEK